MTPTTITQPRTTREPSIRLDRDEQRVAAAQSTAAPRPPMMATTRVSVAGRETCRASWVVRPSCATIRLRARRSFRVACRRPHTSVEVPNLAKTPRTWTGARTPSGLKRVRQAQSRHEVLQPRRTAAKTFVAKALTAAAQPAESTIDPDGRPGRGAERPRSRRQGRRHPPERRRTPQVAPDPQGQRRARWRARPTGGRVVKTTGKAAAAKAAKARIAAGKAGKAKGAQTAAGKARAALSKTARAEAAAAKAAAAEANATPAEAKPAAAKTTDQGQRGQDDQDGRPRSRAATEGRPEGDGQGRSQRRRPRPRSRPGSLPPTPRRPGSPGAFRFRRREGWARATRRPRPASAIVSGFGRKTPYSAGPAEAAERRQHEDRAGAAELLAPVEGRERVGVGHAGRRRSPVPALPRGSAGRRSRRRPGRRSVRRGPGRGSRCRRRRRAP